MLILVEGADGSGKSTLANILSKQTGWPVIHRSKPNSKEEKQQMLNMYLQAIEETDNIIFDRCWYSEMVYGTVMREESSISIKDMRLLERKIAQQGGGLLIYCTGHPKSMYDRATSRGEDYITDFATFTNICANYECLMFDMPHELPLVTYSIGDKWVGI